MGTRACMNEVNKMQLNFMKTFNDLIKNKWNYCVNNVNTIKHNRPSLIGGRSLEAAFPCKTLPHISLHH